MLRRIRPTPPDPVVQLQFYGTPQYMAAAVQYREAMRPIRAALRLFVVHSWDGNMLLYAATLADSSTAQHVHARCRSKRSPLVHARRSGVLGST
eukprot:2173100-Prymnesium_polylepis.1